MKMSSTISLYKIFLQLVDFIIYWEFDDDIEDLLVLSGLDWDVESSLEFLANSGPPPYLSRGGCLQAHASDSQKISRYCVPCIHVQFAN